MPAMKPLAVDFSGFRDLPEDTVEQIGAKSKRFRDLRKSQTFVRTKAAADLYVAAFLLPKAGGAPTGASGRTVPTTEELWMALNQGNIRNAMAVAPESARAARALHWPLEFPDVMQRGGFDVVLGNPPWERIKLQEQEFFAARSQEIANATTKAIRDSLIKSLERSARGTPNRLLHESFISAKHEAEAISEFVRINGADGGRFPLAGRGDVNTYALFAELFSALIGTKGRAGIIVPTGIATDATTAPLFNYFIKARRLISLFSFYEIRLVFPATDDRSSFCLLTLGQSLSDAQFAFSILSPSDTQDLRRVFSLSIDEISAINPNSQTVPVFRSRADADLTSKIYQNASIFINENIGTDGNPWQVSLMSMFHMSNDSGLFRGLGDLSTHDYCSSIAKTSTGSNGADSLEYSVPLYEAKMIQLLEPRFATYKNESSEFIDTDSSHLENPRWTPSPRHWVPATEVERRLSGKHWHRKWLLCWRDITNSSSERTTISTVIPRLWARFRTAPAIKARRAGTKVNVYFVISVLGPVHASAVARSVGRPYLRLGIGFLLAKANMAIHTLAFNPNHPLGGHTRPTIVPAFAFKIANASWSLPMPAILPPLLMKAVAASTFGPIDPAG